MTNNIKKIGLALSGGGVRASAFHAGVLLYLAEKQLLDRVVHISSVSGGTLFTGLLLKSNSYQWPTSEEYTKNIYFSVRKILTTKSLQHDFCFCLLKPRNWKFFLSRANVLAQSIKKLWGIDCPLGALPTNVMWTINGVTSETGRRFRFKQCQLGDYELGYADASTFDLATAMAVSAAFPVGIGPVKIESGLFSWKKMKNWDDNFADIYFPPHRNIHIYDGGIYDNLGIETFFDVGSQSFKSTSQIDYLISSDAGAPYRREQIPHPLSFNRAKRLFSLATEQSRALRVRCLMNFLAKNQSSGLYCQLGSVPNRITSNMIVDDEKSQKIDNEDWLSESEINEAKNYKTTLSQLSVKNFDLIARHGYESVKSASIRWE